LGSSSRSQERDRTNYFGSAGVGSSTHFAGEQFKLAADSTLYHVPYKGPPEALLDTLTGRIQYSLSPLAPALSFIKDGSLLALAVTTHSVRALLQDVPTVAEAGVPGFELSRLVGNVRARRDAARSHRQDQPGSERILALPMLPDNC